MKKVSNKKDYKKVEENSTLIILEKNNEQQPLQGVVDAQRKGLFSLYRKTQKMSNIIMAIAVTCFVASFIMIVQKNKALTIIGWCLIAICFVGMVVFYILTKNKYPDASKKYFKIFWKSTNEYLFFDNKFTDCQIDTDKKYVISDVLADRVYKDVIDSASRNIVFGNYNGQPFTFGELAYYKAGERKRSKEVIFVGRRLEMMNNLHFQDRYIINIKGSNPTDLPTDIEDLTLLKDENGLTIYGPSNGNIEKDLGKGIFKSLERIKCVEPLLNLNIVFWPGHTIAYMSYDDSIVAIPFDKAIDLNSYATLKGDIKDMFELIAGK